MKTCQAVKTDAAVYAAGIGTCAWQALLEEVYTAPKPGLVDPYTTGAHRDMDVHTFEQSARALRPYFTRMALQGLCMPEPGKELFRQIRKTGIAAEHAMYRATGGVNTHKGLIFTIGIFCAAAGCCLAGHGMITDGLLREAQLLMTAETLAEELGSLGSREVSSNGERNYSTYGTSGIRGEALRGYPTIWDCALPVLRHGLQSGADFNRVKLQTLFALMSCTEDSNIISRHSPELLHRVQEEAGDFLKRGGAYRSTSLQELAAMDRDYTCRNISAGGCADLLAAAVFLEKISDQRI